MSTLRNPTMWIYKLYISLFSGMKYNYFLLLLGKLILIITWTRKKNHRKYLKKIPQKFYLHMHAYVLVFVYIFLFPWAQNITQPLSCSFSALVNLLFFLSFFFSYTTGLLIGYARFFLSPIQIVMLRKLSRSQRYFVLTSLLKFNYMYVEYFTTIMLH